MASESQDCRVASPSSVFRVISLSCQDCRKPSEPIRTGVGFLDHMVDQFNSHAQIGIALKVSTASENAEGPSISSSEQDFDSHAEYINRFAALDQGDLQRVVGNALGAEFRQLLEQKYPPNGSQIHISHFACPLDEALVLCRLEYHSSSSSSGDVTSYNLAPYGKFPVSGRRWLGRMQTQSLESAFWPSLAKASGLSIQLEKIAGDNAHHIVESSFKAFSRALRNLLDGVDTSLRMQKGSEQSKVCPPVNAIVPLYNTESGNWKASVALQRAGSVSRKTKETSIEAHVQMDGGVSGVSVHTGIPIIDSFYTTLFQAACMSAKIECSGDLWIDDHHTSEDVSIAIGQVIAQGLGSKAGLNRMWSASSSAVSVIVDLSNRPMLTTHGLTQVLVDSGVEDCDGLALEMWEHVLDSLVVQARMTCHVLVEADKVVGKGKEAVRDTMTCLAKALGESLLYCASVDQRRAGATASSKGTLSV